MYFTNHLKWIPRRRPHKRRTHTKCLQRRTCRNFIMTSYNVTNLGYDQNRDTEIQTLTGVRNEIIPRKRPFDWCILSVLGYMCCPCVGLCAMYYAIRTNHGHDYNIEDYKIHNSGTKAKILTILSIVLGSLVILSMVILIAATVQSQQSLDSMDRNEVMHG